MERLMDILTYEPQFQDDFRRLNVEWLEKYFVVEPVDEVIFDDPAGKILGPGGQIFFAQVDGIIAGTCAVIHKGNQVFELSKMGVNEVYQGRGIGRALIQTTIDWAQINNVRALMLETNQILETAIGLYKKMGFQPVALSPHSKYARSNYRMVLPFTTDCDTVVSELDGQTVGC